MPFTDEKVRQAMALALDRQRIVDNFYPPGSVVADQFLPQPIFGYRSQSGGTRTSRRPRLSSPRRGIPTASK